MSAKSKFKTKFKNKFKKTFKTPKDLNEQSKDWIKKGSKQYYYLACFQFSLYPFCDFKNILNNRGKEIFNNIKRMVKNKEFKDTIENYSVIKARSGNWFPNSDSEYYDNDDLGMVCTWNNVYITGTRKNGKPISTSFCIIIFNEHKCSTHWCYTYSGNLYKLGKKEDLIFKF